MRLWHDRYLRGIRTVTEQATPTPGDAIRLSSATWQVLAKSTLKLGYREVHCQGLSGLVRDKETRFVSDLGKAPTFRGQVRLRGCAARTMHEDFLRGNYAAHI